MFEQSVHPPDSLLYEYLDGELASTEWVSLETHLAGCPGCQARLTEFRELYQQIAGLPDLPPAHDLAPLVLAVLPSGIQTPRERWILTVTSAAQVVLAGSVLFWLVPASAWQHLGQWFNLNPAGMVSLERVVQTFLVQMGVWSAAGSNGLAELSSGFDSLQRVKFLPQIPILELGLIGLFLTLAWFFGNSLLITSLHHKSKRRNS